MKLKTSSCKGAALGKDLSRFWPVWVCYGLFLLLMQVILSNDDLSYWYAANIASAMSLMGVANGVYALIVAQMVFGDLFNSRMCNGLHALPLKREHWFSAHVAAGLWFSLIPTALMLPLSETIIHLYSNMVNGWQLPLCWFAVANLQYLFFFGLAVLCVMCAGNRFGATIVYGILNFGSLLVYLLVDRVYVPLLKGVVTLSNPFERLCPIFYLANLRFVDAQRMETGGTYLDGFGRKQREYVGTFEVIPDGWVYTAVLAVLGIVLLLLARQMYKKRALECAGDFLAVGWLEPVFQVVFTILCGAAFHGVFLLFFGLDSSYIYLVMGIGMLVGWFAGRMLLERSTQVFRLKTVGGFLLVASLMAASLFVTKLDPLGIQVWVPEKDEVKSAVVSIRYQSQYATKDPEELSDLIRLHEIGLEQNVEVHPDYDTYFYNPYTNDPNASKVCLTYVLNNGLTAEREYYVLAEGEGGDLIRKYFSRLDVVFGDPDIQDAEDLRHAYKKADGIYVNNTEIPEEYVTEEFLIALADAVAADCAAGSMVQLGTFHPGVIMKTRNPNDPIRAMPLEAKYENGWRYINIYADCENVMKVLKPTGVMDLIQERVNVVYG